VECAGVTQQKTIGVIALTAVAAYVVWRIQEAQGGAIVWVNPFTGLSPNNPSPVASEGSGATNPLSAQFRMIAPSEKRPGNLSSVNYVTGSRQTSVSPLLPPDELTRTAQPQRPMFLGEDQQYLPNLGDPNLSAYDYLASTPPDLSWGLSAGGGFRGI
jgi:hypothetical protein